MIFPALIAIAGISILALFVHEAVTSRHSNADWRGEIAASLFFIPIVTGLLLAIVGMPLAGIVGHVTGLRPAPDPYKFSIVAAADGTLTEGQFFIFGGYIDEEPVYHFYRQSSDGGIRQGHVVTSKSTIYEDTSGDGYVVVNRTRDYCTWYGCAIDHASDGKRGYYEIHVPPNSVVKQFNFDLE